MAVTASKAVHICTLEMKGEVDYSADEIMLALMKDTFTWDPDKHKVWDCSAWAASTVYSVGDVRKPTTANGYAYRVKEISGSGTSASAEPTWPTTFGNTVVDNEVTWECWSYNTVEDQITLENGYTGPVAVSGGAVAEDEANNQAKFTCDDESFTASGGTFGPTDCAILFNNTHAEKPILGHYAFGISYTPDDGVAVDCENIVVASKAIQGVVA